MLGISCHSQAALTPEQEPTGSRYHLLPQAAPAHREKRSPVIKGKGSTEMPDGADCITLRIFLAVDTYLLKAKYALA